VAITGIGMISPGGLDLERNWESVRDARCLLGPASAGRDDYTRKLAVAEIRDFDPSAWFDRRQLAGLDPVAQYAVVAAREALAQSGVDLQGIAPDRTRCIIGSGTGGEHTHDEASRQVYDHGATRLHPMTVPKIMMSAVASHVALDLRILGGVYAVSSACASAAHAIGQAFADIRAGLADVAVAGGSEACLTHGCMKGWQALHVLSDDRCRPFSRGRRGLVLGEGAAMFVLEDFDLARSRGADILAELIGFGMSSDAGSITSPDADGMARAIRSSLNDARLDADAIDHVNAHGTGTEANDSTECAALSAIFGERLSEVPVTASKSVLGHALGASGALELAMAVMTLRRSTIPPTANHAEPDPGCPIDCVPNVARDARVRTVLSTSFAFGGLNAALVARHV
jgi:nodulation protein E